MPSLVLIVLAFFSTAFVTTPVTQEENDTFFSGTVDEFTPESVTVTREVLGNRPEHRTFAINAQTKVEGKLSDGCRVTVKFRSVEDALVAETIVVRDPAKTKKK